jgi:hypothetical protein
MVPQLKDITQKGVNGKKDNLTFVLTKFFSYISFIEIMI